MRKKLFFKLSMLLFVLGMSANAAWGQGIGDMMDGIDPENPATWFYVNLTAQPSTPACGTNPGQVWLRSVAPTGDEDNPYADSNPYMLPAKPANPYDEENDNWNYRQWSEEYGFSAGMNDAKNGLSEKSYPSYFDDPGWTIAAKEGYDAGWNWYKSGHYLNPVNPVGFAATVSSKGYTVVYAPGFEDMNVFGNVFSAYASFYGKAQENDGWYFTGWSFTDGDSDLGVGDENGVLFRVLPAATAGETNIRNEYVYATFKPVMVSDYKVNGLINKSVSNMTTIVFDAVGEGVGVEDFNVSCLDDNFTAEITSCDANKVTVTVTYNGSANGEFRGNVTLASKSGCSQLTAPVYARVGADATNEATLYDGKTPTATSGTLKAMIAAANGTNNIVVLNKNYESNLSVNANVTLNFNGYTVQDLTVAGGEVTIAYDKYGSNGEAVSVTGGKLILNGGEFASLAISAGATVEQNGATITGAATNNGTLVTTEGRFEGGLTSAGTLTVDGGAFEGTTAVTVSGGTAIFNKAAISGTITGILVSGGTTTVASKLVSVYGGTNAVKQTAGSVTLQNGKFDGATPLAGTIALQGGYFKTNTPGISISGKKVLNVLAGTEFAEGYRYFIGDDATGVGVCRIGTTSYATLEAALAYANNKPDEYVVIIMTNDYTLPAGYYTLPARATLIVPMSDEQETGYEIVNRVTNNSVSHTDYVQPYEFRRLTFAYGVNMDVHGTIELSGTQRASDDGYAAMPHGAYGHLVMEDGSHMTLQSGSLIRAWGYMTGKGETDARRGSKVREQFQMGDWKGGSISFGMLADSRRVFPITQYFIQNVESPVKYHPGALLSTTTSVSAAQGGIALTAMANDIVVVGVSGGDPAMFFMDEMADAENTWVRKWYDAEHDVQTYDVNSGAHIGSMVLDLGKLGTQPLVMNSATFVLPITNNMKIHLLSGQMDFTQTTALLPGAEVEVDKESTVTIYTDPADLSTLSSFESNYNSWVDNGQEGDAPAKPILSTGELFVYDADEWGNYAKGKGDTGTKYTKVVKYSASLNAQPGVRSETTKPGDATINVHGTFNTGDGAVYTTAGGANIFSSNEDAGSFIVNRPTPTYTAKIYQVANASASSYESTDAVSAKLKNGDGAENEYTETAGYNTNMAFLYRDNTWQNPIKDNVQTFYFDCYTAEVDMEAYAADVMAKANNIAIYYAPDNIAECLVGMALAKQAWSTDLTPVQYEAMKSMISAENMAMIQGQVASMKAEGYDLGGAVQHIYIKPQEWLEIAAQAHIKLNFDQDYIDDLEARYNNGEYNDAVNAYMEYVQAQAYNPYLEGVDGNTDHTYSDADGAGRLFILMPDACQWWEVEKKDNLYHCIHPNNNTYYYWDEDEEMWMEKRFTITWKNWDGEEIKSYTYDEVTGDPEEVEYSVTYGTMAEYLGTNPTRESNVDYTYDFTGWSPALGPVTSDVTYTATYEQKDRMYTIIFLQEGGVEIERQFLKHNEIPVCENTPTKIGHTLEWSPAIAAVTGDATYTATWLEEPPTEYAITFFDYDGTTPLKPTGEDPYMVAVGVIPTPPDNPSGKPATTEYSYVFDHWSPALEVVSATSIKSYTAVYREVERGYTISYFMENGTTPNPTKASESLPYGATPTPPTVTKENPATGHTYTLVWKTLSESGTIQTVTGDASYKPTYIDVLNKYTVTVKSNPSGACSISGSGLYDYDGDSEDGNNITITVTPSGEDYINPTWSDNHPIGNLEGGKYTRTLSTLTNDVNLVINFTYDDPNAITITWNNEDGSPIYSKGQKANTATIFTGATPTKDATAAKTYTFYGWSTAANGAGTIYKNGMTPKATAEVTYYAYFTESARTYDIVWKNEAGTADIEVDYDQPYGTAIAYNSATPTKQATAAATYTFDGWSTSPNSEDEVVTPSTVSGDATFYAHFAETTKTYTITWKRDDGTLIENTQEVYGATLSPADPTKPETAEYTYAFREWSPAVENVTGAAVYTAMFDATPKATDLEIGVDDTEDLGDAETTKANLVITSNGESSGQLLGAANLEVTGEAIFKLQPAAGYDAEAWYAVAVPWTVNPSTGIYAGNNPLSLGSQIYVIEFDANAYAGGSTNTFDYWTFLQAGDEMLPGKLYMIWMRSAQASLDFHKKAGAAILTTETAVSTTSGDGDRDNWNAIANPALFHADLGTGVTKYQTYDNNEGQTYTVVDATTNNLIVAKPIFVQVEASSTVYATVHSDLAPAPRRAQQTENDAKFVVEIAQNNKMADRLIVETADEKANEYVIGKDLAKFGVSSKVAQMWVNRYDAKLCANVVEMAEDRADYPLSIFAPAAGEYTMNCQPSAISDQYSLYLTYNGQAIWNLSDAAYTLTLEKGTDANYGLRISVRKTPDIVTGCDEAIVDAQGETRKVLINGQVFIIRGEKVYSIDGQLVK